MKKISALLLALFVSLSATYGQTQQGTGLPPAGFFPDSQFTDLNATYLQLTASAINTNYRLFTLGSGLVGTDAGAKSTYTISLGPVLAYLNGLGFTTQQGFVNAALGFSGVATGDMVYFNGTNWVRLPIGSSNNVLVASGGVPAWSAAGNMTSFSSGNLSPLFTTSVATPTTTPALSFSLSTAAANTVFGNNTASTAAPSFSNLVGAQFGSQTGATWFGTTATGTPSFLTSANPHPLSIGGTSASLTANAGAVAYSSASALALNTPQGSAAGVPLVSGTSGTGAPTFSALNLAGGSSVVTGTLPTTNLPIITLALGVTNNANTASAGSVIYSNASAFLPNTAAGSAGIPLVSGTSGTGAPTFSALNLAGGSSVVTGLLPAANQAATTVNSTGNLSPLFNSSISSQALSFSAINQSALQVYGGSNAVGGASAAPAFNSYDKALTMGGGSNVRSLPTSGTLTGDYWNNGNWTQTGAINSTNCRIFNSGTMTINNTWTINTEMAGAVGSTGAGSIAVPGGDGAGLGGGGGGGAVSGNFATAGGGGGHGGAGGYGSVNTGAGCTMQNGGQATGLYGLLTGSGGGSGCGNGEGGTNGGNGGGSLYIESTGNISFTSAAVMTATGGAGTGSSTTNVCCGGGGSGGGIQIRCLGTVTIASGGSITATGGAGGSNTASGGSGGGGGGGGVIDISGSTVTNSGTVSAAGGAAGSSGSGSLAASAGNTGVVNLNSFVQLSRSAN